MLPKAGLIVFGSLIPIPIGLVFYICVKSKKPRPDIEAMSPHEDFNHTEDLDNHTYHYTSRVTYTEHGDVPIYSGPSIHRPSIHISHFNTPTSIKDLDPPDYFEAAQDISFDSVSTSQSMEDPRYYPSVPQLAHVRFPME
ncbi:predicted protein [Scheffersomyces stipitis CBS 6054]|uniref:Uncharacterized protein n=1 Tax=Scheffersomyces stipitis (strain ATCC 58785 / CBS 6054 / NBRC 10063 / NRRL Y-11545) TaxID=322104 RepID=A3LP47_PICST|nr:predicted protein [Scheffersomyces stipitis CBS 6054]ABN64432.1 predicted protein [Scheffersomyces stipitis CBS 6054]